MADKCSGHRSEGTKAAGHQLSPNRLQHRCWQLLRKEEGEEEGVALATEEHESTFHATTDFRVRSHVLLDYP